MYKSLIQLLTGRSSGFTMFTELNTFDHELKEDDLIRELRSILGTEDEYLAYCVYQIYRANADLSLGPIDAADNIILDGRCMELLCNENLVADEHGAALVTPISNTLEVTIADRQALAIYNPSVPEMTITFAGHLWVVPCRYYNDRILLSWPEELGLRGALLGDNDEHSYILNLRIPYPVKAVVEEAKLRANIYDLLEQTELAHAFFFSDTYEDGLSVLVHALRLYSEKLNS